MRPVLRLTAVAMLAAALVTTGCSSPTTTASDAGPVKVGLVITTSGPLAAYRQQWLQGRTLTAEETAPPVAPMK